MIILRNVTKAYQTGRVALSGVTLTIPAEDFVFLVGGNGAGKSTLLKLLTRQEVATSGVVMVGGQDLRELPERRVPAYRQKDRKSTRLNSSHSQQSRMPSSA